MGSTVLFWGLHRNRVQSLVSRVLYEPRQVAEASGKGSRTTRSHHGGHETACRCRSPAAQRRGWGRACQVLPAPGKTHSTAPDAGRPRLSSARADASQSGIDPFPPGDALPVGGSGKK